MRWQGMIAGWPFEEHRQTQEPGHLGNVGSSAGSAEPAGSPRIQPRSAGAKLGARTARTCARSGSSYAAHGKEWQVSSVQISFTNNTFFDVSLFSVEPTSKQETFVFGITAGAMAAIDRDVLIGTEWRVKNSATGAIVGTYQTTNDAYQSYLQGFRRA